MEDVRNSDPIVLTNPRLASIRSMKSAGRKTETVLALTSGRDEYYRFLFNENPLLVNFFMKYPSRWDDLMQKARKYGELRNLDLPHDSNDFEADIVGVFIFPDSEETDEYIEHIDTFLEQVLKNKIGLIDYCAGKKNQEYSGKAMRSFIEFNGDNLVSYKSGQITYLIEKLVERNTNNADTIGTFNKIFRPILENAKSIYNVDIEKYIPIFNSVDTFRNLHGVSDGILEAIKQGGKARESAIFFLKCIFAWGGVTEILKSVTSATKVEKSLFDHLYNDCNWIHGDKEDFTVEEDGKDTITQRKFQVTIDGVSYPVIIESRIKTIESILIKLLADENYNTSNSIRDNLGLRLFFGATSEEDTIPNDVKLKIRAKFSTLLGNNRYIFKNKRQIDNNQLDSLKTFWQDNQTRPAFISSKIKPRSGDNFTNTSLSGYSNKKISSSSVGTEIQFYNIKGEEGGSGVEHHTILDPKKIIQGWVRSSGMITLPQIIDTFRSKMQLGDDGIGVSGLTLEEGVKHAIEKLCVPFIGGDNSVIFSVKGFEHVTLERYPLAKRFNLSLELLFNLLKTTMSTELLVNQPRKLVAQTSKNEKGLSKGSSRIKNVLSGVTLDL